MSRMIRSLISCLDECDSWLLVSVLILCLLGTVMVFGAASFKGEAIDPQWGHYHYLIKHLVRLVLGFAVMLAFANLDYKHLGRRLPSWVMLGLGIGLILLPMVLFGVSRAGCRRWLSIFGWFPMQPIEFVKIALVLFLARNLTCLPAMEPDRRRHLLVTLLPPLVLVLVLALQPNFGNLLVISLLTLVVLFCAGTSLRLVGGLAGLLAAGAAVAVPLVSKIDTRLDYWRQGWSGGSFGYQVDQSLIGYGAGGLDGTGIGSGHQRFWFLPESHTDFIFPQVGEELGLIGTIGALSLFVVFAWRGLAIASRAGDGFGRVTATGLTTLIFIYMVANIGMTTGLLPVMGLPLPFISYGGSALVTNLAAVGILLSIDRQGRSYQKWRARWDHV